MLVVLFFFYLFCLIVHFLPSLYPLIERSTRGGVGPCRTSIVGWETNHPTPAQSPSIPNNDVPPRFDLDMPLLCRHFPRTSLSSMYIHSYECPTDRACDSHSQYLELTKPLYERRRALVHATSEPTTEELKAGAAQSAKDDPDENPLDVPASTIPAAVPEFWLTVLRNHVGLSDLITDRDAGALKHLTDLRIEYLPSSEPKPGFKLIFEFSENEYFENVVLDKTYVYREEVGYSGDFVYDRAIGTEIKWKDEKDLTKEFEIKKQRNKSGYRDPLFCLFLLMSDGCYDRHKSHTTGAKSAPNRIFFQLFLSSRRAE